MSTAFRLSLGANVALLGLVAVLLWREPPAAPSFSVPAATRWAPVPASARPAPARSEPVPIEPRPQSAAPKLTPDAVSELVQAGISRDVIVNVLLEDLNRRTNARLVALQKEYAPAAPPEHELRELSRQSTTEQAQALREALGEEGYLAWDKEQALHALNRARPPGDELPMSVAEADQAYRLQKAFDDEYRELQETMEDGAADPTDIGRLQAQAQQKLDRGLEQLLGRQRLDALRGNATPANIASQP